MSTDNQISDSWEDIDESELEERLEKERQERLKKEQETMASSTANQNGISLLSNGSDSDFRPRLLKRPSPKVTILKRPQQDSNSPSNMQQQNANKTQIKSLEQREKEYAEARLRILGTAEASSASEEQSNPQQVRFNNPQKSSSTTSTNQYNMQQMQSNQFQTDDNVVRLPRGPSGQGFNIRR